MKKLLKIVYLVIFFMVISCGWPNNTTTNAPPLVKNPETINVEKFSVRGNKGISIKEGVMTFYYTSVTFSDDVWVFEQTALNSGITHIDFYLHNGGGCPFTMFDFIASMELLKKKGITITTYARGIVASAAVPLFVMGDKRIIYKHTWIMIHPGGWKGSEYRFSKSKLSMYGEMEVAYANILATRTNISFVEVLRMLNYNTTEKNENGRILDSQTGDHWFNTNQSIQLGIATHILTEYT